MSAPNRAKYVLILGGLSAFGPLAIDMYLPAFPQIAAELGADAAQVQLSLTGCTLGLAVGQLFAGPLSDTFGRRRPLLVGLVVFALASLLCAAAPSAPALAGLRLVQGLGGAAGIVIARAVVRDLYSGAAMARFFSLLMLVNGLAPILAPLLGGQLLTVTSWRGVFLALAVIGAALLAAAAFGVPETLPPPARRAGDLGGTLRTFRTLLADRAFVGHALSAALAFSAMFAYISGSSFVLQDVFGLSPQAFSLVFGTNALGIVLVGQLNARLVGRAGPRRLLAVGLTCNALGGVAVAASAALGAGLAGLLPALFLVVASVGMVSPNATALALSGHPETAGSASALLGVMQFSAGALAAPLVGSAGTGTALPMGLVIGSLSLAAVVVFALLARRAG
ncbi:Bcr/CflA family multidrug efflux MFS transporter [Saccharopolyspora hordei]|uniref:DHA1 family bicyclomycin/chloramphenicol resistance-like MFS transporter n=1 Tax=Saccharopolyspora hordei TaxID=1838 RepID=A0A853ASG5_9PSEU|nr:Bcr/CflA family multidrug efflux MFS transporter [Saccharopolyspora hordei]NYI85081.1 DHA1 family bicyclomycin/chloramphenicol resistance-like MFS transporter [Saccharopolyspora hordei]